MLELRRLHALHAVATHGTVTAAAKSLGYTPPAVSQQLAALAREVGAPLLARNGRRLQLTEVGWRLVAHTRVVLQQMEAMEADLAAASAPAGRVRLAAFATALTTLVPRTIRRLSVDAPQVELTVDSMEPDEAEQAMHRRQVDLAVVHDYDLVPRPLSDGVERHELRTEPVWVALAAEHRQPHDGKIDLRSLADAAWLVPREGNACYDLVLRACGAAGFVPHVVARSTDFQALLALAAAGLGVAFVPDAALFHTPAGLQLCAPHPPVRRHTFALTPAGGFHQPAVAAVLEALASEAADSRVRATGARR
ncbi:MAG TPA: LysR family transcriptional regulator [Acidimicrobiales bacterium]|nr:LysR family transcriptional regulator [Acidimicrobiales bacterium]